jgi:haloalkane dehalogenase
MSGRYRPPSSLYPFASNWLDLADGVRLHYLDEGPRDAPPVLMVHGNPSWSFYYRNLVLSLRDRYRCIVPDHVGCGLSGKPGDDRYDYTLRSRIDDLVRLLDQLQLEQPLRLVVHDWGGMIGFGWAVPRAHQVAACVILNTAAFPKPEAKKFPAALWLAGRTRPGEWLVRGGNAFAAGAARVGFSKPVSAEVRAAYTGPYDSWDNRIATVRFVQDIPLKPGDPGMDLVEQTAAGLPAFAGKPCLLAWGMRDFVFDHHFLARWQQLLPQAELEQLDDCGHYVLEDGGAALVRRISEFLDQHAGALEQS